MKPEIKTLDIEKNWERVTSLTTRKPGKDDVFTGNDVIDAYFNGRQDELEQNKKLLALSFKDNLLKAMDESVKFGEHINKKGVTYSMIFLRAKKLTRFNALFVVDEDLWCSPEFEEIYSDALDKEKELETDLFEFTLIFMPVSDKGYNVDSLLSDGYLLSYDPAKKVQLT